jgi:hypothetical protein
VFWRGRAVFKILSWARYPVPSPAIYSRPTACALQPRSQVFSESERPSRLSSTSICEKSQSFFRTPRPLHGSTSHDNAMDQLRADWRAPISERQQLRMLSSSSGPDKRRDGPQLPIPDEMLPGAPRPGCFVMWTSARQRAWNRRGTSDSALLCLHISSKL